VEVLRTNQAGPVPSVLLGRRVFRRDGAVELEARSANVCALALTTSRSTTSTSTSLHADNFAVTIVLQNVWLLSPACARPTAASPSSDR
jgi:hypothetical protein